MNAAAYSGEVDQAVGAGVEDFSPLFPALEDYALITNFHGCWLETEITSPVR